MDGNATLGVQHEATETTNGKNTLMNYETHKIIA